MLLNMIKRPKSLIGGVGSRPRRPNPPLYIGQWIRRLGMRPVDVARGADIGESHMSLIISGKKYPSAGVLEDIAATMGLTADALKKPPPDDAAIRAMAGLDPGTIARLIQIPSKD